MMTELMAGSLFLPRRNVNTHKGDYGKLLIIGGSTGYTGAPNLCARAAVRAGAGLVYLGVPSAVWNICAVKNDEAMPYPLPCDRNGRLTAEAAEDEWLSERLRSCSVLAIGPGLGRSEGTQTLVQKLLGMVKVPVILDADALWAVSGDPALLRRDYPVIITPHEGEFRGMGGVRTGDREKDAMAFSREYGCVTVLKGPGTIVAFPGGEVYIVRAGNPGMAKGGSGDVLTGILAALLGQVPAELAIPAAVLAHSVSADTCAEEKGEYGMTPTDIIEKIPYVLRDMTEA